jgi:hypothetical protein
VSVSTEEQHVALPKLYNAPSYARPRGHAPEAPRPFDPDEMPITAAQTEDERDLFGSLPAHAFAAGGGLLLDDSTVRRLKALSRRFPTARPFNLRALIHRLLGRAA